MSAMVANPPQEIQAGSYVGFDSKCNSIFRLHFRGKDGQNTLFPCIRPKNTKE